MVEWIEVSFAQRLCRCMRDTEYILSRRLFTLHPQTLLIVVAVGGRQSRPMPVDAQHRVLGARSLGIRNAFEVQH